MRKITTLIVSLACVSVFSLSSCGATRAYGVPAKLLKNFSATDLKTEEFRTISSSVISFGSEFSGAALNESSVSNTDNIALSPISLYMALAMASVCAGGETQSELLSALGDISYDNLVNGFPYLYNALSFEPYYEAKKGKLNLTNSVWIDDNFSVKDECIDLLSDSMYAYSFGADFSGHNEATNKRITNFVKKETNGLIDNDFQVRDDTVFALINTLYLKTTWLSSGELSPVTKSDGVNYSSHTFKKGNETTCTPSYYTTGYNYGNIYTGETFSCFYGSAQYGIHITFIKPNSGYSVSDINTSEVFNEVMNVSYQKDDDNEMISYYTRAIFPLFNASYNKDVKDLLEETFNLDTLFDYNTCDFSSITDETKGLYVTQIQHVNELELTTEGIEGSSATVHTTGRETAAAPGSKYEIVYQDFPVDEAFTYIISFEGIPLFTGVVNSVA